MATTPILPQREIIYDRETRSYGMYLDGELVGFAHSYYDAETTLDELVYQALTQRPLTETEALAHELVALHPGLELVDALDIAGRQIGKVLAYAAVYDAQVISQRLGSRVAA